MYDDTTWCMYACMHVVADGGAAEGNRRLVGCVWLVELHVLRMSVCCLSFLGSTNHQTDGMICVSTIIHVLCMHAAYSTSYILHNTFNIDRERFIHTYTHHMNMHNTYIHTHTIQSTSLHIYTYILHRMYDV